MNTLRYAIYEISALSILFSQAEIPSLVINEENKEYMTETILQENCAMFNQIMAVLRVPTMNVGICESLLQHLVCIDFEGVFDRPSYGKTRRLQEKAANMFSPDGIRLDLGQGFETFVSFERSASMSRRSRIYFIRKDIADKVYKRVTLGMDIGKCQLSKLYVYNGLLFTGGVEIESNDFLNDKSIIIIDNPETVVPSVPVITVEDDGTNNPVRKYNRVERITDVSVEEFDGEGLASVELARKMDISENHLHHSFQIRLPYIKGVVHEVDFKGLFAELGVTEIEDIFGVKHSISDVDLILTKSMFKGFAWMTDNGLSWGEYLNRCLQYEYNLFVSGQDQEENDQLIELNYQLLNTAAVSEETFRPKSLPFAWNHSPAKETEEWLTKATETEYYKLAFDRDEQIAYFLKDLRNSSLGIVDRRRKRAELLQKNSKYINEPIFTKELSDMADRLLQQYSIGKLLIAGDNRYLSDDLMRLLAILVKPMSTVAYHTLISECLTGNEIYAPNPSYQEQDTYTLLRNPHISRNEEAIVKPIKNAGVYREKYLSHLHYVVMVDSRSLIPDRLGGADYDGDLVKTVADPLLNSCMAKDLPLLKIPTATPLIQDANKWQDRFFVIKSTFSSRVGQISNAAFRRSVIAYNENTNDESREKLRQETEILAILTGLEIDSAKSGIKPDLSEYLDTRRTKNAFLTFKNMLSAPQDLRSDLKTRLKWYFEFVDWNKISSNIELLPLYGKLMSEGTKLTGIKPASDEELFTFASDRNWKENLDKDLLVRIRSIISDYEEAKQRVRYFRHDTIFMRRQKDIRRILFMQNKEEEYTVDELYHAFDYMTPYKIKKMRKHLEESNWLFTKAEEREAVMFPYSDGYIGQYADVFCDFSHNGYRILTDILADIDEMYDKKAFHDRKAVKNGDTKQMKWMINGLTDAEDYEQRLIENCIYVLSPPDRNAKRIDFKDAVKCAVALDKRQFAMEVLPAVMLDLTVPEEKEKPKRRWFRR